MVSLSYLREGISVKRGIKISDRWSYTMCIGGLSNDNIVDIEVVICRDWEKIRFCIKSLNDSSLCSSLNSLTFSIVVGSQSRCEDWEELFRDYSTDWVRRIKVTHNLSTLNHSRDVERNCSNTAVVWSYGLDSKQIIIIGFRVKSFSSWSNTDASSFNHHLIANSEWEGVSSAKSNSHGHGYIFGGGIVCDSADTHAVGVFNRKYSWFSVVNTKSVLQDWNLVITKTILKINIWESCICFTIKYNQSWCLYISSTNGWDRYRLKPSLGFNLNNLWKWCRWSYGFIYLEVKSNILNTNLLNRSNSIGRYCQYGTCSDTRCYGRETRQGIIVLTRIFDWYSWDWSGCMSTISLIWQFWSRRNVRTLLWFYCKSICERVSCSSSDWEDAIVGTKLYINLIIEENIRISDYLLLFSRKITLINWIKFVVQLIWSVLGDTQGNLSICGNTNSSSSYNIEYWTLLVLIIELWECSITIEIKFKCSIRRCLFRIWQRWIRYIKLNCGVSINLQWWIDTRNGSCCSASNTNYWWFEFSCLIISVCQFEVIIIYPVNIVNLIVI